MAYTLQHALSARPTSARSSFGLARATGIAGMVVCIVGCTSNIGPIPDYGASTNGAPGGVADAAPDGNTAVGGAREDTSAATITTAGAFTGSGGTGAAAENPTGDQPTNSTTSTTSTGRGGASLGGTLTTSGGAQSTTAGDVVTTTGQGGSNANATATTAVTPPAEEPADPGEAALDHERWVTGYYVGYQVQDHPPSEVDYQSLSHIVMGAVLVQDDGSLDLSFYQGSESAGIELASEVADRAHQAERKALLMMGGAGAGSAIRAAMQNDPARLVRELVQAMDDLGYDGIDLDWEDDVDMDAFIRLASDLRATAPDAILTAPGFPINANIEDVEPALTDLVASLDQYNLMTYYPATALAGYGWLSWHNSPLDGMKAETPVTIADSLQRHAAAGIPKAKLGMGVAFYAICFTGGITAPNQPTEGVLIAGGDNDFPVNELFDASGLVARGYRQWDSEASVPYLSLPDPERHGCRYVSFDDEESLLAKGQFAKEHGYGGTIVWTISQGYLASNPVGSRNPLLRAVKRGFSD